MNNTTTTNSEYADNLLEKSLALHQDMFNHHYALEAIAAKADILALEDYLYSFRFATKEAWDEDTLEYLFMVTTFTNEDGYTITISTEDNKIRLNCDNCIFSQRDLSPTLSLMLNAWGRIAMVQAPEYIESIKQRNESA